MAGGTTPPGATTRYIETTPQTAGQRLARSALKLYAHPIEIAGVTTTASASRRPEKQSVASSGSIPEGSPNNLPSVLHGRRRPRQCGQPLPDK